MTSFLTFVKKDRSTFQWSCCDLSNAACRLSLRSSGAEFEEGGRKTVPPARCVTNRAPARRGLKMKPFGRGQMALRSLLKVTHGVPICPRTCQWAHSSIHHVKNNIHPLTSLHAYMRHLHTVTAMHINVTEWHIFKVVARPLKIIILQPNFA